MTVNPLPAPRRTWGGAFTCPACTARGTSEAAIAAHVMRHHDDGHFKLRDIYRAKLRPQAPKVPLSTFLKGRGITISARYAGNNG